MKIKTLLLISFLTAAPFLSREGSLMAQSMTDEQVLTYVTEETQKGTSQSAIVSYLVRKGVTTAQLQRVRRKAERLKAEQQAAEKGQLATPTSNTELRQKEIGISGDVVSADSTSNAKDLTKEMDEMNARKVFGRNIFNTENLTFAPAQNIATPANYVLGAGDEVVINIWGASQQTVQQTVSADGYIVIPNVGLVRLAGLTVSKAKATLKEKLGKSYGDSHFELSVGGIRSLQIQVMGEVVRPGTYTLSSLSSAFNALYAAGGINELGTLRDIRVFRHGQKIATIDV